MTGFDDLRHHHAKAVVTSTERFGEPVTIKLPGGAARPIDATCVRSTVVVDEGENGTKTSVDQLSVRVTRDPVNGIDDPIPGYTIMRESGRDPDRRPYQFDGEIEKEGLGFWILIFQRPTLRREGR